MNTATPTLQWSEVAGASAYEVTVNATAMPETTSTSYTSSALSDDTHSWKVRAKNAAGSWGDSSSTWSFTVDTTLPSVTFDAYADASALAVKSAKLALSIAETGNPQPTLTGVATDGAKGKISNVQVKYDSTWNDATPTDGAFSSSSEAFKYTTPVLTAGRTYTFEGRAIDYAGNTTPTNLYATLSLFIQAVPLSIQLIKENGVALASGDTITSGQKFTLKAVTTSSYINITKLTATFNTQNLYAYEDASGTKEVQSSMTLPSDLSSGTYALYVSGEYSTGEKFSQNFTGLTVQAPENVDKIVNPPVITVTPAPAPAPDVAPTPQNLAAKFNMDFQASGVGEAIFILYKMGATKIPVMERRFPNINVGKNNINLDLISNTGVVLEPGVYEWDLKYKDQYLSGVIFVP